jgi:hypothetical protein
MNIPRNGSVGMLDPYLNIASQAIAGESPHSSQAAVMDRPRLQLSYLSNLGQGQPSLGLSRGRAFRDFGMNVTELRTEENAMAANSDSRPPLPSFTVETAIQKVRTAKDAWNMRDPQQV